jgi:ATP-binding cassette subfamily E protein 1
VCSRDRDSEDRCKPKKCRQECKKSCPVVKTGKLCIEVNPDSKVCSSLEQQFFFWKLAQFAERGFVRSLRLQIAFISEVLCIGCGICPKKCVFLPHGSTKLFRFNEIFFL